MWKSLKLVVRPFDRFSFWVILVVIAVEIALLATSKFPPLVPLWYSKPWSLNRLGHSLFLYLIPLSSLLILLINNSLANVVLKVENVISKLISFSTILAVILGLISLLQILLIVRP